MKRLLLSTSIAAILVMPAYGQSITGQVADTVESVGDQVTGAVTGAVAGVSAQGSINLRMMGGAEFSADDLIGHRVYAPEAGASTSMDMSAGITAAPEDWDDIGEIGDVLIDSSGSVNSVVVDAGGFLGIGERNVRVELSDLQFVSDSDDPGDFYVIYTGSRALLEAADDYNSATVEQQGFMSMRDGGAISDRLGAESNTSMTTGSAVGQNDQQARPDRDGLLAVDVAAITADDLQGARVYGHEEDWIGDINTVVMSDDGQISHVVIDVGGWLGIGVYQVALGFDQVDLRRDGDNGAIYAYVDYSQEELEAMPEWTQ